MGFSVRIEVKTGSKVSVCFSLHQLPLYTNSSIYYSASALELVVGTDTCLTCLQLLECRGRLKNKIKSWSELNMIEGFY